MLRVPGEAGIPVNGDACVMGRGKLDSLQLGGASGHGGGEALSLLISFVRGHVDCVTFAPKLPACEKIRAEWVEELSGL